MWSVALYGAETWTILKAEKAKIEAKHLMTKKIKNEEVFRRMKT